MSEGLSILRARIFFVYLDHEKAQDTTESEPMRFRTYSKIPRSHGDDTRTAAGPWVALEKLHGAHFVVAVHQREVHFGKRKEWLGVDTPFFGWQLLAEELRALAGG